MDEVDWTALIQTAQALEPTVVKAVTYRRSWDSACRPVHVTCDDGNDYVAKGSQVGRSAFNDQVVGRIANQLGAPVAEISLVEIDPELIRINGDMAHMAPGLAHGSRYVPDCTECLWFQYVDGPANRPRFALLSVLYGWMVAAEKQFFYSINPPNLVYSFDHDAFFPRGPSWSIESLGSAPLPEEDDVIVTQCGLKHHELRDAASYLERITPEIIASAIGAVPPDWGPIRDEERIALAGYLWERCRTMRS
jgi:hypothetical protein